MIYAGIGPRKTPEVICQQMTLAAQNLAKLNYTLRSGGAKGADQAFEYGCSNANGQKEIFYAQDATREARLFASSYHPRWEFVAPFARDLLARNIFILLGKDFLTPVDFVLTWHLDETKGGTGYTLRVAREHKIPIFNLATMDNETISNEILEITQRLTHETLDPTSGMENHRISSKHSTHG